MASAHSAQSIMIADEGAEKTGHAREPAERKAVEETKPSGVGLPQNDCDRFPSGWFDAARAILRQQCEENQHNNHGKHGQCKSVRPSKFLSEPRREQRRDESS